MNGRGKAGSGNPVEFQDRMLQRPRRNVSGQMGLYRMVSKPTGLMRCRRHGENRRFVQCAVLSLCMILVQGMAFMHCGLTGEAAGYTYTVTFYPGNHGTFESHEQVSVDNRISGSDVTVSGDGSYVRVSGLEAGDIISFDASMNGAVALEDGSRYYVKGIRQGGRDNSTVDVPAFRVEGDQDYVVAYGIRGDMTAYVVHYQDAAGNTLAQSRTYYGNIGDKPVIAFLYIEGYQPQAYNLTKTLSANEAENVFTFVYRPIEDNRNETGGGDDAGTNQGGGGGNQPGEAGNEPGTGAGNQPGTGGGNQPGTTGGAGNEPGTGAGNQPGTGAGNQPGDADGAGDQDNTGTPEGNTPDSEGNADQLPDANAGGEEDGEPRDLVDLDEDEVPLGGYGAEGTEKKVPFGLPAGAAIGIGAAVILALTVCLMLMRRKKVKKEKDAV